jgi:hypothetical protein
MTQGATVVFYPEPQPPKVGFWAILNKIAFKIRFGEQENSNMVFVRSTVALALLSFKAKY